MSLVRRLDAPPGAGRMTDGGSSDINYVWARGRAREKGTRGERDGESEGKHGRRYEKKTFLKPKGGWRVERLGLGRNGRGGGRQSRWIARNGCREGKSEDGLGVVERLVVLQLLQYRGVHGDHGLSSNMRRFLPLLRHARSCRLGKPLHIINLVTVDARSRRTRPG